MRDRSAQEAADAIAYGTLDSEVQRIHEAIAVLCTVTKEPEAFSAGEEAFPAGQRVGSKY